MSATVESTSKTKPIVASPDPMTEPLITGVAGLDVLFRNSLAPVEGGSGLIMLIRGRPGSGKTTLALQIANAATRWRKGGAEKVWCANCEAGEDDFQAKKKRKVVGSGVHIWDSGASSSNGSYGYGSDAVERVAEITKWISKEVPNDCNVIVVDGLNLLSDRERDITDIERLIAALRKKARIGILVFEPTDERYSDVDYQSDVVIEMRSRETTTPERYFITELSVTKSRYFRSALGWHQYKIRDKGIEIFPSIHFRIHQHETIEQQQENTHNPIIELPEATETGDWLEKDSSIIGHILAECRDGANQASSQSTVRSVPATAPVLKGLKRGSLTVMLGPRGTDKTILSMDFLRAGSIEEQDGLLVSMIDTHGAAGDQRKSLCRRNCGTRSEPCYANEEFDKCYQKVFLLPFRPGCITVSEVFDLLEHWLTKEEATKGRGTPHRLVFWDLAQLEYCYPLLAGDPLFLPGMRDYLRHSRPAPKEPERRITSVFMGASSGPLARSAIAVADNVLFFWQDVLATDGTDGVAVYVDRVEASPGANGLFFIRKTATPIKPEWVSNEKQLVRAGAEIEAVKELQGLPMPNAGWRTGGDRANSGSNR